MKTADFTYELPRELIANYPAKNRTDSRLLCLNRITGEIKHQQFKDIFDLVLPNDLLVFNNSKVIPARLFGMKKTGGKIEVLVERVLDSKKILAHVRSSHSPKVGSQLMLENAINIEVLGREDDLFVLSVLSDKPAIDLLEEYGHIPLPPYIERADELCDQDRYQTVYAKIKGSVAAPTAGLHFDEELLEALKEKGVQFAYTTLHVGAGTFQPVRVDDVHDHKMHSEWISVSEEVCEKVRQTKEKGGRVIAVGTTSVRALETASLSKEIKPYEGETSIFIYPGFQLKSVDAMITNFHLPESTLLMLISAFAGKEKVFNAYHEAIKERYRFFSYGDAMFIYTRYESL